MALNFSLITTALAAVCVSNFTAYPAHIYPYLNICLSMASYNIDMTDIDITTSTTTITFPWSVIIEVCPPFNIQFNDCILNIMHLNNGERRIFNKMQRDFNILTAQDNTLNLKGPRPPVLFKGATKNYEGYKHFSQRKIFANNIKNVKSVSIADHLNVKIRLVSNYTSPFYISTIPVTFAPVFNIAALHSIYYYILINIYIIMFVLIVTNNAVY